MLQFVVPMFQDIFKQQNVELPGITLFIVNLSNVIQDYGWLIILIIISLVMVNAMIKKKCGTDESKIICY